MPEGRNRRREAASIPDAICAELVLIDQIPLRRAAALDCTDLMAQLEEARADWQHFERKDKPAFVRWRAREFGPLLSKAREVEIQIRESQALVHEVEMEMRRGFQDAHTAYRRVMFRRAHPSAAAEDETAAPKEKSGAAGKLSEFEQEALFQEWVHKFLGTNPDKMDDVAYSTTFESFKSHMFRNVPEPPPRMNSFRAAEKTGAAPVEKEDEPATDARVKELYRILVRRLHPDARTDGATAVSALWHEVQEAYAASDIARMELLLALSGMESEQLGEQTSLNEMRLVAGELSRALRALEKSVREAAGEDAWNFARIGPNESLRLRVQRELQANLAARSARLDLLSRTIAGWAQGPVANRKKTVRQPRFAA